jgi:hypothetical protein
MEDFRKQLNTLLNECGWYLVPVGFEQLDDNGVLLGDTIPHKYVDALMSPNQTTVSDWRKPPAIPPNKILAARPIPDAFLTSKAYLESRGCEVLLAGEFPTIDMRGWYLDTIDGDLLTANSSWPAHPNDEYAAGPDLCPIYWVSTSPNARK